MRAIRFTQTSEADDTYRVEIALEGDGPRQTAVSRFQFRLSIKDQEEVRWYLEDYLQYPQEPAPQIAERIEARMTEIGRELFHGVFQTGEARDLWATVRQHLSDTRVEVVTEVREAAIVPWELIRDPVTDTLLALYSRAFVRSYPRSAFRPHVPQTTPGSVRILLVISRPRGREDVAFRSVASRLIKSLNTSSGEVFRLNVLRPPTFESLGEVLRKAKEVGEPYHVVHFDGHGVYQEGRQTSVPVNPYQLVDHRPGQHGYLLFENPLRSQNMELIDGPRLGRLLRESGVPVLVLNACRSAHADPPRLPLEVDDGSGDIGEGDPRVEVRAFGSLAQEVMNTGATAVVAMRYSVYVVTAAQFVANLYASLVQGYALGEAVTLGRKQLHDQPLREIAYDPVELQDWVVPVVYEAAPMVLFPKLSKALDTSVSIRPDTVAPARGNLGSALPPPPDAGFFGRDDSLLDLDRAFDTQKIVLLHGYAGDGKTSTAAEFARWYTSTGGVSGPVFFTSFEQHKPLARVLDSIEQVFGTALKRQGIDWLTLGDSERRAVALNVLRQVPVLWVWDNVEQVAGFPEGRASSWSTEEQRELVDFLRDAQVTKARFMLTSRRDEHGWLGNLPARITLSPMPMQERVQLTRALTHKRGRRLSDVEDWQPLLRYTQGNPLTITAVVGEALRAGLQTRQQIEVFVANLRRGEAAFSDEDEQGRASSLGASLDYGFEHAFTAEERKRLALLCFYQGFVAADVFSMMGRPESWGRLDSMCGFTYELSVELLNRAAEVGLLTPIAQGASNAALPSEPWHFLPSNSAEPGRYYAVHPAIPGHLKRSFNRYYPEATLTKKNFDTRSQATAAFVEVIAKVAGEGYRHFRNSNPNAVQWMAVYETNLLHAREVALAHGWWDALVTVMQGIGALYQPTGRWVEWSTLVNEVVPHFTEPTTDGPLPEHETVWHIVTEFRVRLAYNVRQWDEVQRLLQLVIDTNLRQLSVESVESFIAQTKTTSSETLDHSQSETIVSMTGSLHELGLLQRELGHPECIQSLKQSMTISNWIGDSYHEKHSTFAVGVAYFSVDEVRDLRRAERWFNRYSDLLEVHETWERSILFNEFGNLARERAYQALREGGSQEDARTHLQEAVEAYHQALELTPSHANGSLVFKHNSLSTAYRELRNIDASLKHSREAIKFAELAGDLFEAGHARFNAAITSLKNERYDDARLYAQAALNNFGTFGQGAAAETSNTHALLTDIERAANEND